MRRLVLTTTVLLAGCATAPQTPAPQPVAAVSPILPRGSNELLGLTAGDLVQRFGSPTLQIREGVGLKLQFRSRRCVLDAYLYPPQHGQGPERVAHVDTRVASGADIDRASCVAALQGA